MWMKGERKDDEDKIGREGRGRKRTIERNGAPWGACWTICMIVVICKEKRKDEGRKRKGSERKIERPEEGVEGSSGMMTSLRGTEARKIGSPGLRRLGTIVTGPGLGRGGCRGGGVGGCVGGNGSGTSSSFPSSSISMTLSGPPRGASDGSASLAKRSSLLSWESWVDSWVGLKGERDRERD